MIIRQIINNNVLFVEDKNGCEMLLMGKGIGYKKKSGEQADVKAAQKIFTRFDKKQILKFKRLMEEIPYEYMHITNEIVEYAQISLGKELDESIYLALVDHLNFAVNHIRQGIRLNLDMDHSRTMTKIIQGVLNIVKYHFSIVIDEESLDYERFVTHLKFFIQRTMHDKESRIWDKTLMDMIRSQYADSYGCAEKVAKYMKKTTPYEVSEEEMMYLTVHLQRLKQASEEIRQEQKPQGEFEM